MWNFKFITSVGPLSCCLEPVFGRYVTIQKVRATGTMNMLEIEIDSEQVDLKSISKTGVMVRSDITIKKVCALKM